MKKKEKIIGSIIIALFLILFIIVGYAKTKSNDYKKEDIFIEDNEVKKEIKKDDSSIRVEIKGEVNNPNVYSLKKGDIVLDLVKASGGYKDTADKDSIIQAAKLSDGACIIVRKKGDNIQSNISNPIAPVDGKININTATKEQLMKLDGIGESRAEKIIEYREKNGPYTKAEDLKKAGARIGDTILKNIKDKIEIP